MSKRKGISKGLRFDIFKRDGFTCQYCGSQPPDVVLQIDHIKPVIKDGTNDEMNLVSSCEDCNLGKGKKLLDNPQRPDADLAWLESQQELAELQRYQQVKSQLEHTIKEIVEMLQKTWLDHTGLEWYPSESVIRQMLAKYSPHLVEQALIIVAPKATGGYVTRHNASWLKYTYGVLKNMVEETGDDFASIDEEQVA
jgi:hypothetical protein